MPKTAWRLTFRRSPSVPPLAWLLRARPPDATLSLGAGVRECGAGIVEGTWVGDDEELAPLRTPTMFGSAVLVDGAALTIVPPGHMLEGVYVYQADGQLLASNSLAGLLAAADVELLPDVAYPALFNHSVDGIARTPIPTSGEPITACFYDHLRLTLDGALADAPKPPDEPFTDFTDYRRRLADGLASALAKLPGAEPVVTVSSGYDGAAVAVLAAEQGCRRAVTIGESKPVPGRHDLSDSGEAVGRQLGMDVSVIERLLYRRHDDLPEAEFLATGFSGEEVVLLGAEPLLAGNVLLSGFFGDGMWWLHRPPRPRLWRSDQSGSSLAEWRLRVGFVHVPLPCIGAVHQPQLARIARSPEMRPWILGRRYDKPIARRIIEQAGIPRGTFGEVKRAASASIHVDGPRAMAPASVRALECFAASEGIGLAFSGRPRPSLLRRGLMRAARRGRLEPVAFRLESYKHSRAMHEPSFGSLLLRWAVAVVGQRYAEWRPTRARNAPPAD